MLFCTRGKLSLETAERLRDEGFDACSLKGGYLAWLMRQMQRQEAEELCSRVENSLRKRFRLKLWCNFTKAIRQYELVKPNVRIAVCMSGGKDSMLMAKLFQELQRCRRKFGSCCVMRSCPSRWNTSLWTPATARRTAASSKKMHES